MIKQFNFVFGNKIIEAWAATKAEAYQKAKDIHYQMEKDQE